LVFYPFTLGGAKHRRDFYQQNNLEAYATYVKHSSSLFRVEQATRLVWILLVVMLSAVGWVDKPN